MILNIYQRKWIQLKIKTLKTTVTTIKDCKTDMMIKPINSEFRMLRQSNIALNGSLGYIVKKLQLQSELCLKKTSKKGL